MNKYTDFQELPDISWQSLANLFVKRNYTKRFQSEFADDIIIIDKCLPGDDSEYSEPKENISTKAERDAAIKLVDEHGACMVSYFKNGYDCKRLVEFELAFLNPLEVEDYYIRQRVESYLSYCNRLLLDNLKEPEKPYKSLRRVYSFVLAQAYHNGETLMHTCRKEKFMELVKIKFGSDVKPSPIYQTVRSSYKGERNFLNFFENMKEKYSLDYDYAMKIYKNYYFT